MLKYEPDDDEVRRNSYCQYGKRCDQTMQSHPEEEVEKYDLEEVIKRMCSDESHSVCLGGFLLECEMGREVIVDKKTEKIADGISDVYIYPVL